MTLSIIIVNWNSKDYVRRCIESIRRSTDVPSCEVFVVDSASYDGCGEMLAREFPAARFMQCPENVGFARANNMAFAQSTGDVVLFLNPDTEVAGTAIAALWDAVTRAPDAGAVGARLLNTDGSVQTSCVQCIPTIANQLFDAEIFRRAFPRLGCWGLDPLLAPGRAPVEVEAVSGACLMVSRAVFERVGRFSEDYFLYTEDLDLCYKFRRSGRRNYYAPGATVVHHGGRSSARNDSIRATVLMRESVHHFLRKVHGQGYAAGFRGLLGLSAAGRVAVLLALLPWQRLRGHAAATRLSLRKWSAILQWTLGTAAARVAPANGSNEGHSLCAASPAN